MTDIPCPPSHRVNRAENWLKGRHCSGVVQCGTCGRKRRYDITFNASPNSEKRFSERVNGKWRQVRSLDDLAWEFEEEPCQQ